MMRSTPTRALLDVNVLIAAIFADHLMHPRARRFVEGLERFYTTPTTQGGLLRFATRPLKGAGGENFPPRLMMTQAMDHLAAFTNVHSHRFLPDDVAYAELSLRAMQGHRQWTDAYLLHLARKHFVALASLESRMSSLDDATSPVLFVV